MVFSTKNKTSKKLITILAGDLGTSKTNLAFIRTVKQPLILVPAIHLLKHEAYE